MRATSKWTPKLVPNEWDQTVYIVEEDFGPRGRAFVETDLDYCDLETVINDLDLGQYRNPIRVVSFNVAEGWSRDVSEDIAREILRRHDIMSEHIPSCIDRFVERHIGSTPQLALRLV
jgi:hypothetical protein